MEDTLSHFLSVSASFFLYFTVQQLRRDSWLSPSESILEKQRAGQTSMSSSEWHALAEVLGASSRNGEMASKFCGVRKYARNSFTEFCKDCALWDSESRKMITVLIVVIGLYYGFRCIDLLKQS
jgi:hypothetical protein